VEDAMESAKQGSTDLRQRLAVCRARADTYEHYLDILRHKRATYQGGYLQALQQEVEEIHCRWLLANQDLLKAEMAMH
jgi:septum formation topological specificity factor MinE